MLNCPFFTNDTALHSRISAFANTDSKKDDFFKCSEAVGSLSEKDL